MSGLQALVIPVVARHRKRYDRKMIRRFGLPLLIIFVCLLLSLCNHWEPSHETWGYWAFSRILAQTGKFIILDRSPAYVAYLLLFRWLPFPLSVLAEYVVTTGLTVFVLFYFFSAHLGRRGALVGAILWIPFLQMAEPPTQKLALACSCLAVLARGMYHQRKSVMTCYALLLLCYLLRSSYSVFLVAFFLGDCILLIRTRQQFSWNSFVPQWQTDWPLLIVLSFLCLVLLRQSPHPWNTVYFGTTTWFPYSGKHFEILQGYNMQYMLDRYGTFVGHDFFQTNKEVFGGAQTTWQAIHANPRFVFDVMQRFWEESLFVGSYLTIVSDTFISTAAPNPYVIVWGASLLIVAYILIGYGAWQQARGKPLLKVFIGANACVLLETSSYWPNMRYLFPFIPILLLAASWYAGQVSRGRSRAMRTVISIIVVSCLSNGIPLWWSMGKTITTDLAEGKMALLQRRSQDPDPSLVSSYSFLQHELTGCSGVMTLDHTFLAAFSSLPLKSIYDIWEIPPYGAFPSNSYHGLTPQRIPCLALSKELQNGVGAGTNYQLRYQHYIVGYAQLIQQRGAVVVSLPSYGNLVKLSPARSQISK